MLTDKQKKLLRLCGSNQESEALAALLALKRTVENWNLFVDGLSVSEPVAIPTISPGDWFCNGSAFS